MAIPPVEPRDTGSEHSPSENVDNVIRNNENDNERDRTVSEESVPSPRREATTWTTIERRRARSLSSLENTRVPPSRRPPVPTTAALTTEQKKAVNVAAGNLTSQQRRQFLKRHTKVAARTRDHSPSSNRGEGTSRLKNKTIDLGEWGGANLSDEGLDVAAQAAVMSLFSSCPQEAFYFRILSLHGPTTWVRRLPRLYDVLRSSTESCEGLRCHTRSYEAARCPYEVLRGTTKRYEPRTQPHEPIRGRPKLP
jgi:hypothetical protein